MTQASVSTTTGARTGEQFLDGLRQGGREIWLRGERNVTFACSAGRADVWGRRDNAQGAENLVAYQAHMRDHDLSTTHALEQFLHD